MSACADVTEAHLAAVETLDLNDAGITGLRVHDFDGLISLEALSLMDNHLSSLPEGIFDGLPSLKNLRLDNNQLQNLPDGIFDELTALVALGLNSNELSSVSDDDFDSLTRLTLLRLDCNQLTVLPDGVFDELTALQALRLDDNELTTLQAGVLDELTALGALYLSGNSLAQLPDGIFDELIVLTTLDLQNNQLRTLPGGIFDELIRLTTLDLRNNLLPALPDGIFGGLTKLGTLRVGANTVDPLPVAVSLESVGDRQFKAVAPTGAPFTVVLPVIATNGVIEGGATTITIAAGRLESEPLTVSGTEPATSAVAVDIGALPSLPRDHSGYALESSQDLPLEVIPSPESARTPPDTPANQRYEYDGSAIVVSWDASSGADSYTLYYDDFFASSCNISFGRPSFCEELATDLRGTSYTHTSPDRDDNYYWVVACNSYGCSGIDSANPARLGGAPPQAPANQRYEYDGSAIALTWDASADADSYTVYYDDFFASSCNISFGRPSFCEELATGLTGASYTHTSPDDDNYYWVVACNNYGCSEIDSANSARLGGAPPQAPANQRYEYDGSAIALTWDASADADSYTVYYDDFFASSCNISFGRPSFCEELATDLVGTNYTHADPNASRNYYWVVACNNYGCSEIDSANPAQLAGAPPQAPANQRYEYEGSAIVVTWDASPGADSYTVYYDDFHSSSCNISFGRPSFCEELATGLTGASYTHASPDRNDNYYWVVACNDYGCSGIDSANPAALGGAPPQAPANQRYEYDGSAIVVTWDASPGADSYTVYYDDFHSSSCNISFGRPSFCEELATGLTGASYTHASPDRNDNYYWVVACNDYGCSGIDSANPAALGGAPPQAPANQRYEYDGSAIVVTWDASPGADSYTVYYDDFHSSSCNISFGRRSFCEELATDLTGASYTHTSPDRNDNYYWVVACNNYGCSEIDSANPAQLAGAPPQAPANQRYEHDGSTVAVSWDASPDAASYTVYYDDFFGSSCRISFGRPSFCDELATGLTGASYTHADPNASRNYYWVVACNSFGCSGIDSGTPALLIGAVPAISSAAHAGSLETGEAASVEGRILARRLSTGQVEFGFRPEGEALILPTRRLFPTDARVGRWLISSEVASDGEMVGRITARLRADGRIEFGFNPVEGERVLPPARFFPTTARVNQWLQSTIIEVPLVRETGAVPASPQRDALVALYNTTDGGHWRNRTNWASDAPLASWYGVTTDSNGHVTELELSDNQLSGALPADLADLEQLEALYLNDNQLSGAIPAELGKLSNLVRLLLAGNELSGGIPAELGNLPNLELLLLGDNKLSGKIPPELGKLSSLNVLALQANELSGEIPPEVGDLTKLETLFLYENELEGEVPPELGKLFNLQILALHDNQLSGTLPDTLGDLVNLVAAAVCELNPDLVCNLAELVADTVILGVDAVFSTVAAVGGVLGDIGGAVRDVVSAIIGILGGFW